MAANPAGRTSDPDRAGGSRASEAAVEDGRQLRRTLLAVGAAWMFPGLGHVLFGKVRRGVIFAALILFSFGLGLAHDGRLALRDGEQPILSSLQVMANLGMGPLDLVARVAYYGAPAYVLDKRSPHYEVRRERLRNRTRSLYSNYGTAYIWTAGLMNLLLLFDVWDIGRGRRT